MPSPTGKVFILGSADQAPQPDYDGNVLMLASAVGTAKHVIFKVKKWDPAKHPKGAKGLFIETPDKLPATQAGVNDVIATKSGKVFQVTKQTEKGVKVTPVDIQSGEVKSGYTVLGNDIQVAVVEKAQAPGSVHEIQDVAPGTIVKTKAGKRFKVSKHGKWTTVYPVDDDGEVAGKHTVLQPGIMVTVDAAAVKDAPTKKDIDAIDMLAEALAPGKQPQDEMEPEESIDPEVLKGALADALTKPLKAWMNNNSPPNSEPFDDEGTTFWINEVLGDGLSYPGNGETFALQLISAAGFILYDPSESDKLEAAYEAALEQAKAEATVAAPSKPVQKLKGTAAITEFKNQLGDAIKPLFEASDDIEVQEHVPYTLIEDTLSAFKAGPELPENTDAAYADFKEKLGAEFDSYGFEGAALWEVETDTKLKVAWDKAFQNIGIPYTEPPKPAKKQVVQEIMPTKLPKIPKPYPPGVGKDTRIRLRGVTVEDFNGNAQVQTGVIVERVFTDGSVGYIGTAETKAAAMRMARAESGAHEEIQVQLTRYPNGYVANLEAIRSGKLKPGDRVAAMGNGIVYEVEKVGEKPAPSWQQKTYGITEYPVMTLRAVKPDGSLGPPSTNVGAVWVKILADTPTKEYGHYAKVDPEALIEAAKGMGHKQTVEIARKAHPEKYSPYLQPDWNPDELVGASVTDALKGLGKLGYREIKPRQKEYAQVVNMYGKRLKLWRDGNKVASIEQSTASQSIGEGPVRDYAKQLQEALDSGGDLASLDPSQSAAKLDRTNHARQLLYDMAVGKRNGVAAAIGKTGQKVKSDAEYLKEIEAEGAVASITEFYSQVEKPPLKLSARGTLISDWGLTDDPRWDFPNRLFTPTDKDAEQLTADEMVALSAILKHQGVSTYVETDLFQPGETKSIEVAAARLAAKLKTPNEIEPENTREYLKATINARQEEMTAKLGAIDSEWAARADNLRAASVEGEIAKRRAAEGTVAEATAAGEFDLPTWEEVQFEAQTFEDISQLVAEIGDTPTDVPAFYKGGVVKDSVLQHRAQETWGKIDMDLDGYVIGQLESAGGIREGNRNPIDPGYQGSGKLYNGEQITLIDTDYPSMGSTEPQVGDTWTDDVNQQFKIVGYDPTKEEWEVQSQLQPGSGTSKVGAAVFHDVFTSKAGPGGGERRIEYVLHDQPPGNAGGAPTSQRGRLTLIGYTPEEAAKKLQQLGLLGELEPEVPFKSLLRSTRRYGHVAPIHSAYVRGEAPLPKTPARITHGVTNTNLGGAVETAKAILRSGGLMSIWERHRHGMLKQTKGVSIAGDIRSGIDHGVFCTLDGGGACGSGSQIKFVMKPSAYLRRDILMAPHDFGGMDTRYPRYKSYLNKLQSEVGVEKTNLYAPVDPKVRQRHLDSVNVKGSVEYNIAPTIPIEDMEAIQVPDQASKLEIEAVLDSMLHEGHIASKPRVVLPAEGQQLANKKTDGAKSLPSVGIQPGQKVTHFATQVIYTVKALDGDWVIVEGLDGKQHTFAEDTLTPHG